MEELIHLKNKIHIKSKKKNNKIKKFQIKWDKLVFFKENISNLEKIYDNMKVLRAKGNSLPILIIIEFKYPNISYSLNEKEKSFEEIIDFLFRVKGEQISKSDDIYKENEYSRFLYGKLFISS